MSTPVRREPSVIGELMNLIGAPPFDPQVRVEEWVEDGHRIIRADLPGVDPRRDIELSVENGMLYLRGERRAEKRDRHRTEMRYGSFSRVIALPSGVRAEDVTADYVDGVLTVSVPERKRSAAQTIPVNAGGSRSDKALKSQDAEKGGKSKKKAKKGEESD